MFTFFSEFTMFIKLVINVGLLISCSLAIESGDIKWIESFIKSTNNDKHIHQVVFLINDEKAMIYDNPIVNEIIKKLSSTISVCKIVLPNSDKPTITYNPRISLFIVTNSENDRKFTRAINYLTQLSEAKCRPKCLLLLSEHLLNYRQFFETLWNQQFLDVTIMKIEKPDTILNNVEKDSKLIYYNPFLKLITTEIVSDKTIWFPDKLQNLHGYPIVASLIPAPPDVFAQQNPLEKLSGLAIRKIEILKEILNFTFVKSSIKDWGTLTCSNAKGPGALEALFNNQVQIFGLERTIALCNGKGIEFSKGLRTMDLVMMVPLIKKNVESIKVQWHKTNIIIVLILPLFVWIISRLMKFHSKKWRFEYLIRIVLGFAVPEEPQATSDKFLFLSFLIACLMFSSDIFTSITRVKLENKSSFKYETFKDVLDSDLEIMFEKNYFMMINNTDDVILKEILKKSHPMMFSEDECLKRLLKYKNITCFFELSTAKLMLQNRRDKCGGAIVKFFTKKFPSAPGATLLGAGTPYANRFDQVIQRLIESGISKQWMKDYSTVPSSSQIGKSCNSRQSKSTLVTRQMIFILVIGFGFATLTLILELISYCVLYRKKWKKNTG